jgi:hypothetical protein
MDNETNIYASEKAYLAEGNAPLYKAWSHDKYTSEGLEPRFFVSHFTCLNLHADGTPHETPLYRFGGDGIWCQHCGPVGKPMQVTNRKQFFRAVPARNTDNTFAHNNGYTLEWTAEDFEKAKLEVMLAGFDEECELR